MIHLTKKKVIKKFRWKVIGKFFVSFFVVLGVLFYLWNLKTKNIIIEGNHFLKDATIIETAGFKDYPYLFQISNQKIKERLSSLELIEKVTIKKSIFGTLNIIVDEATPLFYNRNTKELVLKNKKQISSEMLYGVPILVNYVPDIYYEKLIEKLNKIQPDVLSLISEIEYQPWQNNNVMIDETRFFLRMNDTNNVYVNLIHMEKLNNYIEIYATLEGKHGTLYLDSSSDKISFSEFK